MTRDEAKQLLPVIQAFAEGKEVQYRFNGSDWATADSPTFNIGGTTAWRIKPEPQELWIVEFKGKDSSQFVVSRKPCANPPSGLEPKLYREVIE